MIFYNEALAELYPEARRAPDSRPRVSFPFRGATEGLSVPNAFLGHPAAQMHPHPFQYPPAPPSKRPPPPPPAVDVGGIDEFRHAVRDKFLGALEGYGLPTHVAAAGLQALVSQRRSSLMASSTASDREAALTMPEMGEVMQYVDSSLQGAPPSDDRQVTFRTRRKREDSDIGGCNKKMRPSREEAERRKHRADRFSVAAPSTFDRERFLESSDRIVGTSSALEKAYLRLTDVPDPATVRPPHVLKKSFAHVVDVYARRHDWRWAEEQFRSLRQDMTVQGVRDGFAVAVYESNASIALENRDLGQFNQCQTQLIYLYRELETGGFDSPRREEFLCYRMLYLCLQSMHLDVQRLLADLTANEKRFKSVAFGEAVYQALTDELQPYPLMPHLVDLFMPRLRLQYLLLITKGQYKAGVAALTQQLRFDTEVECTTFLREHQVIFTQTHELDCRKSHPILLDSPLLKSAKIKAMG
ncbi:MAG: hypothetical protein KVP17_001263 [Porospora cf. gigantea B]|uniref:uncharacterized protein n=1 Tax=Porospora cf. gigantea B TaxID=2853592 RepID=UPI0035717DBD|nr:MAG: hypothetical protein KVP17_001263 [Porospora cf. gigantea B]